MLTVTRLARSGRPRLRIVLTPALLPIGARARAGREVEQVWRRSRRARKNPVVAAVENASLGARVERAVEQAIAARRPDLEQLVRSRVDVVLQELAGEVLDEQLATDDEPHPAPTDQDREPRRVPDGELLHQQLARRCSRCGSSDVLPERTVCRECHRARARELHAKRAARRRNGDTDDDEPHPAAPADQGRKRRREPVSSPESARNSVAGVSENGGIAAEELARRAGGHGVLALRSDVLEAWLLDGGLAQVTSAGLLVPTDRTHEIAAGLAPISLESDPGITAHLAVLS